jgi:NSS family neurotransmitter:Na+ symporter
MAVSISGVFTLLACIFVGPCIYGCRYLYHEYWNKDAGLEAKRYSAYQPIDQGRRQMKSIDYIFSLVGYAIGISNIWRFPYIIAQNGGGAALIAYLVCAVFVAVPLFLYEMVVGQYTRLSAMRCYRMIRPRWTSLGIASGCMLFITLTYFGQVVAYSVPYIFSSLQDPLPWIEVGPEHFWFENILNVYPDLDDKPRGLGPIQPLLAGSLAVLWVFVYVTAGFGDRLLAKITYVTVLLPVFLTVILVMRSVFLPGAMDGLAFYLGKFELHRLLELKTWASACGQIIFSLSPGFGTAITYSSFAQPKEDVYRACLIVSISNTAFSIFAGLAIFSLVGHLAYEHDLPVEEVAARSGSGLAFITIAEAMQYFGPFANAMSVLFFSTLFMIGLDTIYAFIITIIAFVNDFREERGWKKKPMWQTSAICMLVLYMMGLLFTTRMGNQLLGVVDHYVGSIFLLLVASVESIMFLVDFGFDRMKHALQKATYGLAGIPQGRSLRPAWLWRFNFYIAGPVVPGLLGIYLISLDIRTKYGGYPSGLIWWGWALLIGLIVVACLTLWRREKSYLVPFSPHDIHEFDSTVGIHDLFESGQFEAPSITITDSWPTTVTDRQPTTVTDSQPTTSLSSNI